MQTRLLYIHVLWKSPKPLRRILENCVIKPRDHILRIHRKEYDLDLKPIVSESLPLGGTSQTAIVHAIHSTQ